LHVYNEGIHSTSQIFLQSVEGEKYSSGIYHGSDENGIFHIGLETKALADPLKVIGVLAHELSHLKLLGEKRIQKNNEHLTDLTTVFFGLGVINANLAFRLVSKVKSRSISRSGYLSQMEFGYALAVYAHLRHEDMPEWTDFLNASVLGDFRRARNFMTENPDIILVNEAPEEAPDHPTVTAEREAAKRKGKENLVVSEFDEDREMALDLYVRKEYRGAGDALYDLFRRGDTDFNVLRCGIYALHKLKNYTQASEMLDYYAKTHIMTDEEYVNAGYIKIYIGDYAAAVTFLEQAVAENPFDAIALNNLGFALTRLEKFEEALEHLDEAIEYEPGLAYAYNNRGLARIKTGRAEDGLKDIRRSLELKPDNAYSFRNMGIYFLEKKDKEAALRYFEKAKELDAEVDDIDELILTANKF